MQNYEKLKFIEIDIICSFKIFLALILWPPIVSCKPTPEISQASAVVNKAQFEKAKEIIAGIDYLPFAYAGDGCYERAIYISMEIAVAGIPSSLQAVSACQESGYPNMLRLPSGGVWGYHVAPLVVLGGEEYVFDPSTSGIVWKREEWKRYINQNQVPTYFELFNADDNFKVQNAKNCGKDLNKESMVKSFEELRPFPFERTSELCWFMYKYIGYIDRISLDKERYMKERLLDRTKYLIEELTKLGKIKYQSNSNVSHIKKVIEECKKRPTSN